MPVTLPDPKSRLPYRNRGWGQADSGARISAKSLAVALTARKSAAFGLSAPRASHYTAPNTPRAQEATDMTITLGINGFGRIGRSTLMHIAEAARQDVRVVKVNATGPLETAAHLVRYDSVHGRFAGDVTIGDGTMDLGQGPMQMFSTYDMDELDWSGVDVVLECTGNFNDGDKCQKHLERGAKAVLISAPAKNVQKTVVMGVNDDQLARGDVMISNGSCTTNCLAPLAKVLDAGIGIESGIMTTIHSYTGDQPTLDRRHKDLYRARAAAVMSPTGRTRAVEEVTWSMMARRGRLRANAASNAASA
jgi:glyceraldehyde 3-phosphate dehydrogenase